MRANPYAGADFTEAPGPWLDDSSAMTVSVRMSPVDRAWLLMERPTNPMTIVAVMVLNGRLTRAKLRKLIERRFLVFDRFRCCPVAEAFAAHWRESADFDLDDHVLAAALPAPGAQAQLEALAGELASTPFNPTRPWWSFHVVEHYGRGSAVIVRIHHCYADGIALMRVVLGMADGVPAPEAPATQAAEHESQGLFAQLAEAVRGAGKLLEQGVGYTLHPQKALESAAEAAGVLGELAHISLLADDPPSPLKQTLSGSRRVAWAPPLPFEEVRTLSHALGCTINDVLVATLAGALGAHLEARAADTRGITLHAAVPVNLRPVGEPLDALGNRFGLVFVELPVGIRDPLQRLRAVHRAMKSIKASSEALVTFGLLAAVGSLPAAVEETAIEIFTAKASLVASNVPGPRSEIRVGGAPVTQMLFWVPQAGSIGTGVSMLSYNGGVTFGVIADRQLIPEPHDVVDRVATEFERLVLQIMLD